MREIQEAGSIRMHFFNAWNLVEATMLASLSVAMFFRVWAFACDGEGKWFCGNHGRPDDTDVSSLNEVYLAQYFQAASAPFVLGRVLFLTQVCARSSTQKLVFSAQNPLAFVFGGGGGGGEGEGGGGGAGGGGVNVAEHGVFVQDSQIHGTLVLF